MMFYDEKDIKEKFATIIDAATKIPDIVIPAPSYVLGKNWTDENREKNGYTKQSDGTWVTIVPAVNYLKVMEKDALDIWSRMRDNSNMLTVANRKNYEMEYGLRVAEKALKNSLAITKEKLDTEF